MKKADIGLLLQPLLKRVIRSDLLLLPPNTYHRRIHKMEDDEQVKDESTCDSCGEYVASSWKKQVKVNICPECYRELENEMD